MQPNLFPHLFSPFRLGHTEAPNRIVSTSHGTNMAIGGVPSEQLIAYHAAKAAGGCGTVMMFGSAAASSLMPIPANHVNLWQDTVEPGLRAAAVAVKAHGALVLSQVTTLGRRSYHHLDLVGRGPSATGSQLAPHLPHVLAVGELQQIIEDYATACLKLKNCGFDGADLAFYDDQLPDQFWSPAINQRTDRYGGSLENRMRFSLEVLEAVRAAVGKDFIDMLSSAGHAVEIVTRQYSMGEDIGTTIRAKLYERLLTQGVQITVLAEPSAVTTTGIRLRHMLITNEWEASADTVIFSAGGHACDELFHSLQAAISNHAQPPTLHLIGDAYAPRNLRLALLDGTRIGYEIA